MSEAEQRSSAQPQAGTPQAGTPDPAKARKNRILLILLLASFVIPFVVGDLAYKKGWYQGGKTNHGTLIDPPAAFASLQARESGRTLDASFAKESWWLLYVLPANCEAACRNRLFQMRQLPKGLGREGDRVHPLLVLTAAPSAETEALLQKEFSGFRRIDADAASVDAALQRVLPGASQAGELFLMDPMGWLMLRYAPEANEKASIIQGDDIFKDLQKLLKASRIG